MDYLTIENVRWFFAMSLLYGAVVYATYLNSNNKPAKQNEPVEILTVNRQNGYFNIKTQNWALDNLTETQLDSVLTTLTMQ